MKNKFTLLCGVLLVAFTVLCTLPAQAAVGTIDFGITNSLAAATTNTTAPTIGSAVNIDNRDNVALVFNGTGNNTGTGNITITLARSADNVNFETTPQLTWTVAANGTTQVIAYTNLDKTVVGSAGYLKVVSIGNANASAAITNASLIVVKKRLDF